MAQSRPTHTLLTEVVAGLVSAVSIAYIVPLTPTFMADSGLSAAQASSLAALLAAGTTLLYALCMPRPPGVLVPGIVPLSLFMGFAANKIPWAHILGIGVIASLLFTALSASGVVRRASIAMPLRLKGVIKVAIGYYLIAAAARTAGLLGEGPLLMEVSLNAKSGIFLLGVVVLLALWEQKRLRPIAILVGMSVAMLAAILTGLAEVPERILAAPDLQFVFPDIGGALSVSYLDEIFTLVAVLVADVVATFESMASPAQDLRESDGTPVHLTRGLTVSGALGGVGPLLGSGTVIVAFESIAGILAGGRTRVATVVAGLFFAALLFAAPLTSAVPPFASAVALAFVGYNIAKYPYFDLSRDRITRYLELIALVGVVCSSIALALFGCIAAYPLLMKAKGDEAPRRSDWTIAVASVGMLVMILIEQTH
ncbi:MAG: hypothetical protein KDD44_05310 [Bdellovibrionales bacterium]|nr:hypothetical protein [Bdellovibrionales bacterium]